MYQGVSHRVVSFVEEDGAALLHADGLSDGRQATHAFPDDLYWQVWET